MKNLTILAVGPWYPNTAPQYLTQAFERMGHQVIRFGPDYNNPYEITWGEQWRVPIDMPCPKEIGWNLDGAVDLCTARWKAPDLIFAHEETYHNTIITTKKVPIVLYGIDGWPENYERYEDYKPALAYAEDPLGIRSHPRTTQDPRWRFLPGAAAPWAHKDLGIPRTLDFYFCGTLYVNRPVLCERLKTEGFSITYGKADTGTYVHNLSSSLATLHDCNKEDRVKWRFFEGMACGCTMISDYTQLLDWLGYKPWEHYIPVPDIMCDQGEPAPDIGEVIRLLRWIKEHPQEARVIADNGKKWTLNHHTYYHRASTIFAHLHELNIV